MNKKRPTADMEKFLSYRLSIISRLINRRSTRYFNENYGLTLAEWRALAQIAAGKMNTVKAISEQTFSDKGLISRAITSLEKKGLIEGTPNPKDKRSMEYKLSAVGISIHDEIMPMRMEENALIAEIMTPEELELFKDVLARIQGHLNALD
ncbi:MarR family winged helix-turn-helix transcriptional regulator [Kordiimonas pumila]|uniref:MarR family winged helix-turn-helix transcriptional regulator n=1 Tax=Kordiimonas pumila TaxID=2161677 RepID=A0ABV7D7B1_9PROT|nr:MarR family transcriptional regulator [Kordiimonas pumila]